MNNESKKIVEVTVIDGKVSLSMRLDENPLGMALGLNFNEFPSAQELGEEILAMIEKE